jgi:hypothetical protein
MRGNIWAVVAIGTLLALSPAIVTGDGSSFATNIKPLYGSLSTVGGMLFLVVTMGALLRFTFAGGGGSW